MKGERGSALILVMALVALLTAMIMVNGRTIHQMRAELQRMDRQQQQRFDEQNPRH